MNKKNIDDDNRVIADMSNVGNSITRKLFQRKGIQENNKDNQEKLSGKNLRAAIFGSLSASLLIALIYIVAFGILVFILYMLIKAKLNG